LRRSAHLHRQGGERATVEAERAPPCGLWRPACSGQMSPGIDPLRRQAPFRGVPLQRGSAHRFKLSLDSRPPVPRDLRISDPRVLVDLAEQILTVDELKSPAPERAELEPPLFKLLLSGFRDFPDDLLVAQCHAARECFTNPAPRP